MNFITTKQYAELKGCSLQYVQQQIKDGKIKALLNDKAANNRKEYIIPTSELPEKLQQQYINRERVALGLAPQKRTKTPYNQRKNVVSKPLDEYTAAEREEIALWTKIIKTWLSLRETGVKKADIDRLYIARCKLDYPDLTISEDILYRKYDAYRNDDLNGLVDKRGGWNKGKHTIPQHVLDGFMYIYLDERQIPISRCYELLREWVQEFYPADLPALPCERSFRRQAEALPEAVVALCRRGNKAMTDSYIPYIERLYEDIEANDVWIADNHTFDFITVGDAGRQHRIYLTAFIDAKSGVMVGWNLTDNPSSESTLLALRHAMLRFGVPKSVYFDNGSEFLVRDIGGRGHRRKKDWNNKELAPTILQSLGIDMHNAIVRNAKAKPIERTFGTIKNHFSRIINTFCGGTILERPESLKWKLKHNVIPEDDQIRAAFAVCVDGDYNVEQYGGKERRYKGKTRIEVWNESIKHTTFRKAAEKDLCLLLARVSEPQKISRKGVYVTIAGEKLWYCNPATTSLHIGEKVYVRYDPANYGTARIYEYGTDKYRFTWKLSDDMLIPYITDKPDDIAAAEKQRRIAEKSVKEYAKGLTESVKGDMRIDMLDLTIRRATKGMTEFNIIQPTTFVPVMSDSITEENPELSNITEIRIDVTKMTENAIKRKG